MAGRQANAGDRQAGGNAEQAGDKEGTGIEGFLASLKTDEVTLYVHREDLGKHGYLAPPLKFNPVQHNIGHLYEVILKRWGPGSYWIRTQAANGAGFGRGSFTLDIADPTPLTPPPTPIALTTAPPVAAAPVGAAQGGSDVNATLVLLIRELLQRVGGPNAGQIDASSFTTALQGALTSQQQSIAAVTQRMDPNIQGFSIARELLKLSRELGGNGGGGEAAPAGGMNELMMLWMMMQGGGQGGGGANSMLPMMMMMQGQGQGQQNPMQMMQMMQMMQQQQQQRPQQQRPQQQQPPQQPQPDPWGPFPGPWGPTAAPRTVAELERELAELRSRETSTPATTPATTTTTTTPATTPATPANAAPNMLQLDGYAGAFGMLKTQLGLSDEEMMMGLNEMTPEEQAAVVTLTRTGIG